MIVPSLPFLAVDIGNSAIKVGLFRFSDRDFPEPYNVVSVASRGPDFGQLARLEADATSTCFIASVCRPACQALISWLKRSFPEIAIRTLTFKDFPLAIDVRSPDRVGLDRLAAAVAANRLRSPAHAAIVVDAGSAITVDAVSAAGAFLGGAILAGMSMQAHALDSETDLLPRIDVAQVSVPDTIGRDTEQAMRAGIYWGTVGAVREIIARMRAELGPAQLFVAGGDMERIVRHLPEAQLVPNLVLSGIAIAAVRIGRGSID
jgi:type III pantothenate kinase